MQSVFVGGIAIAGFGAAGMLSAVTASDWAEYATILLLSDINPEFIKSTGLKLVAGIYCYRAGQFLTGTSVCPYMYCI